MTKEKPIDLMDEVISLFSREEMIAYFDFQLPVGGDASFGGLCKISRSKRDASQLNYASVLFIVDAPTPACRQGILEKLDALDETRLQEAIPELTTLVPVPAAATHPGLLLKQIDLILEKGCPATRHFVQDKLYPVICRLAGLYAEPLVFWPAPAEPASHEPATAKPPAQPAEVDPDTSLRSKLMKLFRRD